MRKMTLLPHCHVARWGAKKTVLHRTDEMYIAHRDHYEKIQNWLYANMVGSAQASTVIYSLIETTKENNLNLYQHLFWVLQNAHL